MRLFYGLAFLCFALAPALAQEDGYVLQVAGRLVFIDQGEQDNIRPGDYLQLLRQEVIKHPETGENLAGEVALGAVRIVEVFPRLATAEVVDILKGMTLELLDQEARQGLIRVRVLPPEAEMVILERVHARESGMMAPPDELNPDGVLRQFVPELKMGFGSRPDVAWPAFTYQLIDPNETIGSILPKANLVRSDTSFTNVSDRGLLAMSDTTSTPQELAFSGGSLNTHLSLTYPYSKRLTFLADYSMGSISQMAVGARYYPGQFLKLFWSGYNPDGVIGTPVITLKLGMARVGSSSLSSSALSPLTVRDNVAADSLYTVIVLDTVLTTEFVNLDDELIARSDSLFKADVTEMLRTAANDGAKGVTKSGLGLSVDLTWPLTRHFTLKGHWTHMGGVKEYGGKLTYYMRGVESADPAANPDGRIRSPVFGLGGRYGTDLKQKVLDFDLIFPIAQRYTLTTAVSTDLKDFTRVSLAFKTYWKGF